MMKKNNPLKTQIAIFALSLTLLKAAEQRAIHTENLSLHPQEPVAALAPSVVRLTKDDVIHQLSQGMDDYDKSKIIEVVGKIDPVRYTDAFLTMINQLSQGMSNSGKANVIKAVGKIDPVRYTDSFAVTISQLSQGMNVFDKIEIIELVEKIDPVRYTDAFINTVNQLSQGMSNSGKASVIEAVGKIDPVLYTDAFLTTINQLSQGMNVSDKATIIEAAGKIDPVRYTDAFINTVNQLSREMRGHHKARVIERVAKVHPDRYTDAFVNMVNQLSGEVGGYDKACYIKAVANVHPNRYTDLINTVNQLPQEISHSSKIRFIIVFEIVYPDHHSFLLNFIRQNPAFFEYVPSSAFTPEITENMTQEELQELLEDLHREYYNDAPAGTPQGLAFEIHNFANQEVVGKTGEKQRFNASILNHIESSIEGDALDYGIVLDLLNAELATLKNDPLKSDAINDDIYNWVIQINEDPQDQEAIALVVTYLEQKDPTHAKVATWLYTFMDESKNAYDGQNSESCKMGVKERVITSLRSAIPDGDALLENLFHQAEAPFMLAAKSKRLTDYPFWAQKLKQKGVTQNTPEPQAKIKFSEALHDYFEGIMDERVKATIDATLETFDDSESDFEDTSLLLTPGDGLWSKIKIELLKIDQDASMNRSDES